MGSVEKGIWGVDSKHGIKEGANFVKWENRVK